MALSEVELTALTELEAASVDALSYFAMSSHSGGAAPDGATVSFMQSWAARLRSDPSADEWDLADYYHETNALTRNGGNQAAWDRNVSNEDILAAAIPLAGSRDNTPVGYGDTTVRAITATAAVATKTVKAIAALPSQGWEGFKSGMSSVGDYLSTTLSWLKWILLGAAALLILLLMYKVSGFLSWLASSPGSSRPSSSRAR